MYKNKNQTREPITLAIGTLSVLLGVTQDLLLWNGIKAVKTVFVVRIPKIVKIRI